MGLPVVEIPVSDSHFVKVIAEVVDVDVPLLLGLEALNRLQFSMDFDQVVMRSKV